MKIWFTFVQTEGYLRKYLNLILTYSNLMEKAIESKVRECKEIIIQGMEKTIQHKMVYMFLKDHKIENFVKNFTVNSKVGTIKLQFHTHQSARSFYDDMNFIEKILIRPFNIYFNVTLAQNEMKKYYLEGITEQNQRKLFEACRKMGFCKIYTNYSSGPRGKLKPNAVLSFIRKEKIPGSDFEVLTQNLKSLGITIQDYIYEKELRCSINLTNFCDANYFLDESQIRIQAETKIKNLIKEINVSPVSLLTVLIKKREATEYTQQKVFIIAIVEYSQIEETMNQYEKMRDYLANRDPKVVLYFHNQENNSYISLFTQGLKKPADMSEKKFENQLLQDFKQVNKDVIQVCINHVKYNDSYIGRVYLRSEQAGKNFIVDYSTKRRDIFRNYLDGNIAFNINVDAATLRKINQAEKRAKQTEEKIKKVSEASKRESRKPANAYPIKPPNIPIGLGPKINIPNLPFSPPGFPSNLATRNVTAQGLPIYRPPGMIETLSPPKIDLLQSPQGMRQRIKNILKDKATFINIEASSAKRLLSAPLKFLLEQSGVTSAQSGNIINSIFEENDISTVLKYFESPSDLQAKTKEIR